MRRKLVPTAAIQGKSTQHTVTGLHVIIQQQTEPGQPSINKQSQHLKKTKKLHSQLINNLKLFILIHTKHFE